MRVKKHKENLHLGAIQQNFLRLRRQEPAAQLARRRAPAEKAIWAGGRGEKKGHFFEFEAHFGPFFRACALNMGSPGP